MKRSTISRLLWIVVSVIIAVICGDILLHPIRKPRTIMMQAALKDLVLSINNYRTEYDHFPLLKDSDTKADQRLESTGTFLGVLLGKNEDGINPRNIAYIEPPMAKDGKGGLVEETAAGPYKLTDSWGHPYVVLIDGNYDNKIDNPDRKNSSLEASKDAPASITAGVIAYSLGPDGIEGTVDDIPSWRPPLVYSFSGQTWQDPFLWIIIVAMLVSCVIIVGQIFWLVVDLVGLLRGRYPAKNDSSEST